MSVIGWLVLGLIGCFLANKLCNKPGEGLVLGIVGAVVGGFLFTRFCGAGITGSDFYSMFVAVVGAVVVLVFYHALVSRRTF